MPPINPEAIPAMFFAGLILLIPHCIGMSRVNYIIKRYNLPISRAGLLLYKFHNPIEVSLTIGTGLGNVIVISLAYGLAAGAGTHKDKGKIPIRISMIIFLLLMLLSSIFILIFITLFDGITNAFAFGINAQYASLLSAVIPISGALITVLHNIYKFFSDLFHWDDFDYYVLRLQLFLNILTIFICLILWILDAIPFKDADPLNILSTGSLLNLFKKSSQGAKDGHYGDWSPIGLLAISLGSVYAFYPSIAPYSIIDYQYASVIELWILIISAIIPFSFAILDLFTSIYNDHYPNSTHYAFGPSGLFIVASTTNFQINGTDNNINATDYADNCPSNATIKKAIKHNWVPNNSGYKSKYWLWHLVWLCAIFYILCIQIFMSMLHYPDSLLSCFCNKPGRTQFISVLLNTLRELMQACGFAGAGKQVDHKTSSYNLRELAGDGVTNIQNKSVRCQRTTGNHKPGCYYGKVYKRWNVGPTSNSDQTQVDGVIAPCNKLITLFVMMFCVFTGDGYLQHYRRCCRDCWPTTGFNKYQSFFYWLRYGFKGGSKSFTTSFTITVKTQNIITNNVINLLVAAIVPLTVVFRLSAGSIY